MSSLCYDEEKQRLITDFEHNFPELCDFIKNLTSFTDSQTSATYIVSHESTGDTFGK